MSIMTQLPERAGIEARYRVPRKARPPAKEKFKLIVNTQKLTDHEFNPDMYDGFTAFFTLP